MPSFLCSNSPICFSSRHSSQPPSYRRLHPPIHLMRRAIRPMHLNGQIKYMTPPKTPKSVTLHASGARSPDAKRDSQYKQGPLLGIAEGIAFLGGVGGAVAVVLGADIALLSLPIVLPAVSLTLGKWKEKRRVERLQQVEDEVQLQLSEQTELLLDSREGLMAINNSVVDCLDDRLKRLEEKNAAMEATMLATAQNVRQIIGGLKSLPDMLRRISDAQQQNVIYGLNMEVKTSMDRWGRAQLEGLRSVDNKIRFLEDSTRRLEASMGLPQFSNSTINDVYGTQAEPITVDSEPANPTVPFLMQAKDTIVNEISGVLQDLQTSQVDIAQTLQDLSFRSADGSGGPPRFDYLESQMTDLASQMISLPAKMSDGLRKELEALESYKGDVAVQLSSVQMSLQALERTILDIKDQRPPTDSAPEIILPKSQTDTEKNETQSNELQKGFSELLHELALLRSSFNDFKTQQTERIMKDGILASSESSIDSLKSEATLEDLKPEEAMGASSPGDTTPSSLTVDAEPPESTSFGSTISNEETEKTPEYAADSPLQQSFPTAMQFQPEDFNSMSRSVRSSQEFAPSAPPIRSDFDGFSPPGYSFAQDFSPYDEGIGSYDNEPTWSTVVDANVGSIPGDPLYNSGFEERPRFNQDYPFPDAEVPGYSSDPESYIPGDFYQNDRPLGQEESRSLLNAINVSPVNPYEADPDLLERVRAAESSGRESAERYQQSLSKAADNVPTSDAQGCLSEPNRLAEGLRLLKAGREAVSTDFGDSYRLLGEALDCFETHSKENPEDVKSLGNCGNALLALGELKIKMAESLYEGQPGAASRSTQAQTQLRQEAEQLFILAGAKFKSLLENCSEDERGYMNWAKALSLRAQIATDPVKIDRLYQAAVLKYEEALKIRSDSPLATFAYATALREWARSRPVRDPEAPQMMQQAISSLKRLADNNSSQKVREEAARRIQLCLDIGRSLRIL